MLCLSLSLPHSPFWQRRDSTLFRPPLRQRQVHILPHFTGLRCLTTSLDVPSRSRRRSDSPSSRNQLRFGIAAGAVLYIAPADAREQSIRTSQAAGWGERRLLSLRPDGSARVHRSPFSHPLQTPVYPHSGAGLGVPPGRHSPPGRRAGAEIRRRGLHCLPRRLLRMAHLRAHSARPHPADPVSPPGRLSRAL